MMTERTTVSQDEQPRVAVRRGPGSRVTRFGWRLFRDDLSSGRFLALALLGIVAAVVVGFATSPTYTVQAVEVVGSKSLTSTEATRLAGVAGLNIFAVNSGEVAARLKSAPFVNDVRVETRLPNTVRVIVQERRPSVVWVAGDTPYLVEDDGSISGQAATLDGFVVVYDRDLLTPHPDPLPQGARGTDTTLTTPVGSDYRIGGHLGALELDGADAAQRIFMLLPSAGQVIGTIEYRAGAGISIITPNQQRIIFGDKAEIDTKVAICRAMLAQLADKPWTMLDLRSTSRPAVQLASPTTVPSTPAPPSDGASDGQNSDKSADGDSSTAATPTEETP